MPKTPNPQLWHQNNPGFRPTALPVQLERSAALAFDWRISPLWDRPASQALPGSTDGTLAGTALSARIGLSLIALTTMLVFGQQLVPGVFPTAIAMVFTAAMLSSIGGFAFSAICGAMIFHVMPPLSAVQLMIICSIAMQAASVLALRNSIDWRLLSRFLLGGVVTLPLGLYLLVSLEMGLYCRLLGGFLMAYGLYMLLRPATELRFQRRWADCLAGLLGGVTGGFAGFPGAFVTIWCALKGWDKDRQRGVYQPFILIMQILALVALTLGAGDARLEPAAVVHNAILYVPATLLGTWCGLGLYRRLNQAHFAAAVNVLLIAAGAALALR
jgi:uncharacterized membrane protein YfcA